MLLNPKSPQAIDSEIDPYSTPIPGQSLTDEPGKWPWEKPTKFTDVNDAFRYTVNRLADDPATMNSFEKLMAAGVSIQEITRTISFGGFTAGLWTVDIAQLIQPPIGALLVLHAKENGIPYKMFVHGDRSPLESDIPDELVLNSMRENNPEALDKLLQENTQQRMEVDQQFESMRPPPELEGFLAPVSVEEEEI
tara:strand:+ start:1697 stop:2278 length:582 start_codon:yes stop_codon:yes gene_type:complete